LTKGFCCAQGWFIKAGVVMSRHTVFIDGRHGTTGLKIDERLAARKDVELLSIPEARRKDIRARAECINAADVVFLCLPDDASRESVSLLAPGNTRPRFLDASTAHRTHPEWVYGLPEKSAAQREAITQARRVAVPGCHASGFVLLMHPLLQSGLLPAQTPVSAYSITGYSGGGKEMIASYEASADPLPDSLKSPRLYSLGLSHKHLPEMQAQTGLLAPPIFTPIVGPFAQGMIVGVPLWPTWFSEPVTPQGVVDLYKAHYAGEPFVKVMPLGAEGVSEAGFLPATACNGTNRVEIFVLGHQNQLFVAARFDNLGKGASGAAIQCMNLMLGQEETQGLAS
jgi:N-acetyl-gamma-glutamyl-phosphate reductase